MKQRRNRCEDNWKVKLFKFNGEGSWARRTLSDNMGRDFFLIHVFAFLFVFRLKPILNESVSSEKCDSFEIGFCLRVLSSNSYWKLEKIWLFSCVHANRFTQRIHSLRSWCLFAKNFHSIEIYKFWWFYYLTMFVSGGA